MAAVVCWKQKAVRQCRRWLRCERLSAFHACSTLERRSACGHMSVLVVFSCCVCVCVSEAGLDTDKKKKKERQMLFTAAFVKGAQNDDCLDAL